MRDTAATTGNPAGLGEQAADDSGVANGASRPAEADAAAQEDTTEATVDREPEPAGPSHNDSDPVHSGSDTGGSAEASATDDPDTPAAASDAARRTPSSGGADLAGRSTGTPTNKWLSPSAPTGGDPVEVAGEAFTGLGEAPIDRPTFTRPPGMTPPPDRLDGDGSPDGAGATAPTGAPVSGAGAAAASGTAPVSAPPGGVRIRPLDPAGAIGSARVNEAIRATRSAAGPRGPRRARLAVKRLDPWSVMKFSFAVSLVLFIVMIVAASVLYLALDAMGVFTTVNTTLADLIESGGGGEGGESFRITASWVIGTAASLGAINVVLFTALATLGAFIYNVCADLVGGVEVTLAERD